MSATAPLLEVTDLRVRLQTPRGPADALRGVTFAVGARDTVGLIGESGCGKSMTALALMGLLPEGAVTSGSIRFDGAELVGLADAAMGRLRGRRIAMIFQAPQLAIWPGLAIALSVLGLNLMGDGLRDLLDPRLARSR